MKKVLLKSLSVISPKLKQAKTIKFDDRLTIITSEDQNGSSINHTGKSLMIKSLYYALGAGLSKYTRNWRELNIVTIIKFVYSDVMYTMFRCGNSFVIVNKNTDVVHKFMSVSQLKGFYVNLFDYRLKLLLKKADDEKTELHSPYPSSLFLPFYIDQDVGWDGTWKSFSDLSMYKDYRNEIFAFHTGLRNNEYYDLLVSKIEKEKLVISNSQITTKYQITLEENLRRYKDVLDLNIEPESFKNELDALIKLLNNFQEQKEQYRDILLDKYNKKLEVLSSLENVKIVIGELEKDVNFINKNIHDEVIYCPTCGVEHQNTMSTKYMLYLDIEECQDKIAQYNAILNKLEKEINDIEDNMQQLSKKAQRISEILNKKRDAIQLRDVLVAHGIKEYITDLTQDIRKLSEEIDKENERISKLKTKIRQIENSSKIIKESFNSYINTYITKLGISDISIDEIKNIGEIVKSGGSDLSRAILGYIFAYFKLIEANKDAIIFPIVIDTPLQQEQSTESTDNIFDLLLDNQPENAQLIIATTSTHGKKVNGVKYEFLIKQGVLNDNDYIECEKEYLHYLAILAEADNDKS